MRDILFRGKRIDNGEWVYGFYATGKDAYDEIVHYIYEPCGIFNRVGADTVGQYTGLTDKNGKKIFESDVVSVSIIRDYGTASVETGVIGYNPLGMIGLKKWKNNWSDCFQELELNGCITDYFFEILGNIHDNPDMLKDKGEG